MDTTKKLLLVGAHPDDETFGIGATLAQYAGAGVKVYYACATRGEAGTVDSRHMKGYASIGDMRWAELRCASRVLGLADVVYLGYRDSGMSGSKDNEHPGSLVVAPLDEIAGRIVATIRHFKPDVVITHDSGGGYGHPDHITTHNATVKAFYAADDSKQYPEAGPTFQPSKLYFSVRPRGFVKIVVRLMPIFGQNPRRFGRNKDIDLVRMMEVEYPVNAVVRLSKRAVEVRDKAAACHASQGGGRFRQGPFSLLGMVERFGGQRDCYMRDYPVPTSRHREKDLFEGKSPYTRSRLPVN
jgi:N-acetyl-1-D-myo-inositol-2-amino-2-deoxy-alpha-D-glucopyranoside deacetylase